MGQIKIEVGGVYKLRNGEVKPIIGQKDNHGYDGGFIFTEGGFVYGDFENGNLVFCGALDHEDPEDIVERISRQSFRLVYNSSYRNKETP